MKALAKLSSQKSPIPILNTVKVADGKMVGTDMDVWITEKALPGMDDGKLYHAQGLSAGMALEYKDCDTSDFPECSFAEKAAEGVFSLSERDLKDLKWVSTAQSTDPKHLYLNCVYFEQSRIVATDGHSLKKAEITPDLGESKLLFPHWSLKLFLMMVAEKKAKSVTVSYNDRYIYCLFEDGAVLITKQLDGTFPDWKRVVPSKDENEDIGFLSVSDIKKTKKVAMALKKLGGSRILTVAFDKTGGLSASPYNADAVKLLDTEFKPPFKIGFNYDYLLTMDIDGPAIGQNPSLPISVTNANRTAVLMPMRLK